MDYSVVLEAAVDLGYELAMAGAETYRVEESVSRVLMTYGVTSEVFAIPNNLLVSIETPEGQPMTRMRRIGHHGNDLDAVEKFSGLSRAICNRKPEPHEIRKWLDVVRSQRLYYSTAARYLGDFLGAMGFAAFFGGSLADMLCSGVCGILVGAVNQIMDRLKANPFFSTLAASFLMSIVAYGMEAAGISRSADAVIIGALMILVPGLLFTNAMRDVIYGDTNSGVNRVVQVFLVAAAIALGTAGAWNITTAIWGAPASPEGISYPFPLICVAVFGACVGFAILFNIHGPGGLLCALGGMLAWVVYDVTIRLGGTEIIAYFWGAVFASAYSEIMARIRKCPAISYLVVSIFPLIPGAGVYYTMNYAVRGDNAMFAQQGMFTAAVAGVIAVGILLVSTSVGLWRNWKRLHK